MREIRGIVAILVRNYHSMTVINSQFSDVGATGLVLKGVPCDASVYAGAAVYLNGAVAYNALADDAATSNVIGIVERKISSTLCDIRVSGVTPALFVGLDETKDYNLSATVPGGITTVVPTTSGYIWIKLGQPYGTTKFVMIKGVPVRRA